MVIKFGIVGCGHIANRHAKHIIEHPETELISAYDIETGKTAKFCQQYDITPSHSLDEILSKKEIDVITICTPNGIHHEGAIAALNAGKHVLVEKPMSTKKEYCEKMIEATKVMNKEIFIVKQNRFNPPIQALKTLIDEQKLGEVYFVAINCFWNRNQKYYLDSNWKGTKELDGGTLFTQFSHFVDIFYYLFGDIEGIQGNIKNANHDGLLEFEDTGCFTFKFKMGALGSINYTTSSYKQNMEGSITIFAKNATIKIGGKYLNTIDHQVTNNFNIKDLPESSPANNYGYYEGSMSNHDKVINNVVKKLKGKEIIMVNAQEGMKVVEIIEKMYQSVK